jgi:hypothetical protein
MYRRNTSSSLFKARLFAPFLIVDQLFGWRGERHDKFAYRQIKKAATGECKLRSCLRPSAAYRRLMGAVRQAAAWAGGL